MPPHSLPRLAPRPADSHKGDYGHALLIGGSRGMAGAIALAGMSAVRSGAGLVRLAVPDPILETVAGFSACPMLLPLPADSQGAIAGESEQFEHWLKQSSCIALGPGLGRGPEQIRFVLDTLAWLSEHRPLCPLVVDADGLFALCQHPNWGSAIRNPAVLTPHPGEWARLSGIPADKTAEQAAVAEQLAAEYDCVIVLKGHRTLITDGISSIRNSTGTPAMATGGSGDVLTGVITALICQGLAPLPAAQLGVHVHGRAGEIAAQRGGSHVVLPTEIIQSLPAALAEVIDL
ncbi:MAG: NAD(P)H-hydrate dehydratase [Pirellulaceae bacterium]|nr:NAD(P)H-hydrate dehydratase [Pirellulaceae bacterium]